MTEDEIKAWISHFSNRIKAIAAAEARAVLTNGPAAKGIYQAEKDRASAQIDVLLDKWEQAVAPRT